MNWFKRKRLLSLVLIVFITGFFSIWHIDGSVIAQVPGKDILYTLDEDFDLGTLVGVNHDSPNNDQLQLDPIISSFPFINVAASGRGTVVRANTLTGEIVGEYRTAPEGRGLNPSRTTVDLFGNVWTANRAEAESIDDVPHGSAVKIGVIVGGTRVDADGSPNPIGDYVAPPYGYNTCSDRNGDGLIRTSRGLDDILDWPDITDGQGGNDGLVEDAEDECILVFQRLYDAENARHVSVDADNNVWVGGYPFDPRMFHKLDGATGAILDSFNARSFGCGGYGGLIDGAGILWSVGGPLLRYDPATGSGFCIEEYGYGLGIDTNGYIWMSMWEGGIVKFSPDGTIQPGYPKPTYPPIVTTTSSALSNVAAVQIPSAVLMFDQSESAEFNLNTQTDSTIAESGSPAFEVSPSDNWIRSSSPWTAYGTISLTIEDGSGVLYSSSMTADSAGYFNFNLWDVFNLQRGYVVTISDGTTTKTHTVTDLYVDGINVAADTVFGRADVGTTVDVLVHGYGWITTATDISGNWVADFSGITDLTYFSEGLSGQYDDDGDATFIRWVPSRFQVAPNQDWVRSWSSWTPGATISLTIEDLSGVIYSDSMTADGAGRFHFGLWDVFDLQRGHVVTVSDGTTTKIHTVTDLFVDGIDVTADTVFGRANIGTAVEVWVHGDTGLDFLDTTADGSGNWTADFSGLTDLTYLSDGGSAQFDDDGDITGVWWTAPSFQTSPDDDWVGSGGNWTAGATISLTIEDGSGVIYSDSMTAYGNGHFNFELWDVFDLQRGHVVTVSDGSTTKTHTVTNLFVDGVDVIADTVYGRADAGTAVDVWVHGDGGLNVTADGSGNWTADFSGMTDLTYSSDGGSAQYDADGDSTGVWWASPSFQVAPDEEWVESMRSWTPDATISLTIEDGSGVIYTDSITSDAGGYFYFDLMGIFDLQRGHIVTVSDGTTAKTHTVTNLYVDGVDEASDYVYGRADAGTEVDIWVHGDGWATATSDLSGNWVADFSGITDLTYLSDGGSSQYDEDGDATSVWWATPRFRVSSSENWVQSSNRWNPGAWITIIVEDGGVEKFNHSFYANNYGDFHQDTWNVDIQPGMIVTVSDGTLTKTHTVLDLSATSVDIAADTVSGSSSIPGAIVQVYVNLFDEGSTRWVTADASGHWVADFSVADQGQPAYDLTDLTRIYVDGFDDDGDSTQAQFGPPTQANRGVAVTPIDNHVWVANSGVNTVTRLDNSGNVLEVIDVGIEPTGVAVDAAGKVWTTNMQSHSIMRIDPSVDLVDLTVDLGEGAYPYNYSDMTGAVAVGTTSPQGFWTVVQDSQKAGFEWGRITWNTEPKGSEPAGTEIIVEARSADTEAGLGGQPFQTIMNGDLFSMFGRYIEVRVTLKAHEQDLSPVLSDIRIQPHSIPVDIDIKPGSYPNSIKCENEKETISVAVLTTADFDAMTIDHTTVTFEGATHSVVDKKTGEPRRFEEDVDLDGDMDLVFHFRLGDTDLVCWSTEGTLKGWTYDGLPIEGTDSVRMVTKKATITIFMPYQGNLPYETIVSKADLLSVMLSESTDNIVDIVVPDGDWKYGQNEAIAGMEAGDVDIAFISWPATLVAYETAGVQPGLNIVRYGSHFYRSQILTYPGNGVSEIIDLDGRSLCWPSPYSVSGYLVPSIMLLAESVDPDANATFVGSHNQVVWELYHDNCDGGATYVDARSASEFPPDVYDEVIQIAISSSIPNDGFTYRDELSEDIRTQINDAILSVTSTPGGADLMLDLIGHYDGFVESDFSLYQDLYDLIYQAGLTPDDIWVDF
jgi:phosphate/phosphite/phosphonate ABC transporter binding protein